MKKYNVGIVGATGMVGQRFMTLLENHPWFNVVVLAASSRSAGKTYEEAIGNKWCMDVELPEKYKNMIVKDATNDIDEITSMVDFVFCAVNMKKDEIKALEEEYAKHECPVVSNNSAHRFTPDVPMVVPELNAEHINIIPDQRKRLGTKRGFIAVKSNCSLQSYVPALFPLTSAAKKKRAKKNRLNFGAKSKTAKSSLPTSLTSPHSASEFLFQTVTSVLYLLTLKRSLPKKK